MILPPKRHDTTQHAPRNIPTHSQRLLLEQLLHLRNYSSGFWETWGDSALKRQRASKRGCYPPSSPSTNNQHNLHDQSTVDGFECVWDNRFSCFILDCRDIHRPEHRGYGNKEYIVRHVPSRTNPTVHLGLVQVLAWKDDSNTLVRNPEVKFIMAGGTRNGF